MDTCIATYRYDHILSYHCFFITTELEMTGVFCVLTVLVGTPNTRIFDDAGSPEHQYCVNFFAQAHTLRLKILVELPPLVLCVGLTKPIGDVRVPYCLVVLLHAFVY